MCTFRHHSQWSRQDAVRDFEKAQAHLKITPAPGDKQQIKVKEWKQFKKKCIYIYIYTYELYQGKEVKII